MKIACSTAGFTKMKLTSALQSIRELDFNFVDLLMMENWAHINPSELVPDPLLKAKQVLDMLEENSLKAIAINGNLSSPVNTTDTNRKKKNLAEIKALSIFTQSIDIPVIVLQPGGIDNSMGKKKSLDLSINALQEMIPITQEYGRQLAIETHVGSVAEKYIDTLNIVNSVKGLKLAYDPSHFIMSQQKLEDSEPLIEYTAHVHLRNAIVGDFQAEMDKGIMDFNWVFITLKKHSYDGYISIEYIDSHGDYDIKEQIIKLKEIIESA
ncbi:MAG: sugar phosphate isomerase/epimerase family protein [bacterium]